MILLIILSGLIISIIPPIYLSSKSDEYVFCNCENGLAELTYYPSEKYCCKHCNPGYELKKYKGNSVCIK